MQGFFNILVNYFSMKNVLARINWRQVLVHTVAFWFVAYAFETLSYLFHLKIIYAVKSSGNEMIAEAATTDDLYLFLVWKSLSGSIGLLTAFLVSIILSIKRRWFWLNSLLSFILTILLFRVHVWDYTKRLFYYPGRLFSDSLVEFLINGCLLLLIGILLFFSKPIIWFISGKPKVN